MLYQWSKKLLLWGCPYKEGEVIYESAAAGTEILKLEATGIYKIECVGGSGAAAIRGVYDDKGYGWGGGSGGAFVGNTVMTKGKYDITVGKANANTKGQGGNSATLNPADTTKYPSIISGIVECGGGGAGTTSGVGAAGAAPIFYKDPISIELNSAGNPGKYNYGGKGSSWPPATCAGGDSVYEGYGKGQGCVTSEYAGSRRWIAGTGGFVRITYVGRRRLYTLTINTNIENAIITIDGQTINSLGIEQGKTVTYTVSAEGYVTQTGTAKMTEDIVLDIELVPEE